MEMEEAPQSYREAKEAFVSNLAGSDIWEINSVTLVAPAAALLWAILQQRQGLFKRYTIPAYISDFLLHCCAILFATTVYAGSPQVLNGLLILPALAAYLQPVAKAAKSEEPYPNGKEKTDAVSEDPDPLPVKPFITSYRGAMMIVTCLSILAVDFPVFPRRFAKTENFGTSLMDLGVGSFVFSAGVVSARSQLKEQKADPKPFVQAFITRMKTAIRHSLPIFVLGIIRLVLMKELDYAEHVSEYGVHWNFFFTLALLPPAVALVQPIFQLVPSYGIMAFAFGVIYECFLFFTPNLKRYILLSARTDWFSANREGFFSFVGYLCIFLAGQGIGLNILPRDELSDGIPNLKKDDPLDEDEDWLESVLAPGQKPKAKAAKPQANAFAALMGYDRDPTLFSLVKWTVVWFVIAVWMLWNYGPQLFISRRLANLGYIVWVCSFNTAQLTLFCIIESVMFPGLYGNNTRAEERTKIDDATSRVLRAFNRNGLALFLLANLLTGTINMSMQTIYVGDVEAMFVLVAYIGVIGIVGLALDHYNISIKL